MPRAKRIESVFLNIPYDSTFESLYLAYIVGLTQLGLRINAALAVPNQDRLNTIITLIEQFRLLHTRLVSYRSVARRSAVQHAC